ncbi:hypothetical protein ACPPVQ_18770 [Diaminobutyricibacter sp. McL0618]|uniref:hypothetical protein n=1 Tax=Leifsonia sp. McL0618 TaxID=3415677 RepID=UPI003CE7E0F0
MSSCFPLLIDLAGVSRLADVRRPVASVWRSRFGSAPDPFPHAVSEKSGRALFDAMSVAQWLARTGHGNNPDSVADVAASAAPADFDFADASHVAGVDALLTLRAASGQAVGGLTIDELRRRAVVADHDDSFLVTEISTRHESWGEWADLLADAAYSPIQASQLLEQRHRAMAPSAGSAGPLAADSEALLITLAQALTVDRQAELGVSSGITASLVYELVSQLKDDVEVVVSSLPEGRGIRRRLLCGGLAMPAEHSLSDAPRLSIERLPSGRAKTTSEILHAVDDLVLGMRDHDRAIILAPAAALIESIASADDLTRTDVLRTGRVRGIVKLPTGLVTSAPREALALWVLGRETGDVPVADRFTAVADLTDVALTRASREDLTSDVLAAMGGALDLRSHAFRFTRLVRTTSLLASRGALDLGEGPPVAALRSRRDLPALLDQALAALGDDAPLQAPVAESGPVAASARVAELIAQRHLRLLPGTRLSLDEFSDSGLVVVGVEDLDDPQSIGDRRIEQLVFAARHPSARLTAPGDVVFCTAPTAKAWVDPDGSKVVAYPARVLRVDEADPGGLVPELVAADINRSTGGPASWRRWKLRHVAPQVTGTLRAALSDLAARREALARRIEALDSYTELLTDGVVAGAVTLNGHAADAASEH